MCFSKYIEEEIILYFKLLIEWMLLYEEVYKVVNCMDMFDIVIYKIYIC